MTHAFLHAAVARSRRILPGTGDELAQRAAALASALGLPTVPHLAGADSHRFAEIDAPGDGKPGAIPRTRSSQHGRICP
jgi:hypothetical protein